MKFDLKRPPEIERARDYLDTLIKAESIAEIIKVSPKRSLNQNSYLHLLLSAFAAHFGWTLQEAKTYYKREINPDIYVYEKQYIKFLKSSADLSKEDMTRSIDRLRQHSAEQGYPLPTADNEEALRSLENAIEQARYFL